MPYTHALATDNYGTAALIVDPNPANGTHTTIASALATAVSGNTIFIKPGTYTENITLVAGVNLCAYACDAFTPNVTIVGTCTFSAAGTCSISGIYFQTNGNYAISVTGSSASVLNLIECYFYVYNNTFLNFSSSNANSYITLYLCAGDIQTTGITYFTMSSPGLMSMEYCFFENSATSSTSSVISNGKIVTDYCKINVPLLCSSTGILILRFTKILIYTVNSCMTVSSTASEQSKITSCYLQCTTAPAVSVSTTVQVQNTIIQAAGTYAMSGTGTCEYVGIAFVGLTSAINVTTPVPLPTGPIICFGADGINIIEGSGSPNGSITAPQGSLYMRTDGTSSTTRLYINTNSGTSWTAVTTSS